MTDVVTAAAKNKTKKTINKRNSNEKLWNH